MSEEKYDEIRERVRAEQAEQAEQPRIAERFNKPPGDNPDDNWQRLRDEKKEKE